MPTGYTADVQSGKITELKDYALLCARAMGATIMIRDDPLDAEIPEFEPSPFYRDYLANTRNELAEFESMSVEDRKSLHDREHAERVATANKYIAEKDDHRKRYEAMLAKAKQYAPPTAEHQGLADFMVSQLEESIRFDCDGDYIWEQEKVKQPFEQWERERLESLRERIERYASEWEQEQSRTESRNRWIRQLRESLEADATVSV